MSDTHIGLNRYFYTYILNILITWEEEINPIFLEQADESTR